MPRRLWRRYRDTQAARSATSISWNGLFSFVPIVVLLISLLGLLLQNRAFALAVELRIARLGTTVADRAEIRSTLNAFRDHTGLLAGAGAVTLVWSGAALFSAMDDALSPLFGARPRSFLRKRLMAIGVMLIFTVLVVPLLLSASLLSEGTRFSILPSGVPGWVVPVIQFVAGALDGTLIYAAIYHVIPNRRQRLRRVLPGALLAGCLLELVTLLFPLYLKTTDTVGAYGVVFGVVVLLITFFYLLGQITMLGAILNAELTAGAGDAPAPPS